jgi:hypothetical protein
MVPMATTAKETGQQRINTKQSNKSQTIKQSNNENKNENAAVDTGAGVRCGNDGGDGGKPI